MDTILQYNKNLHQIEKNQDELKKEQYAQQIEENNQKEILREQNYKKFFSDYSKNMDKRANAHIDNVLTQEIQKQQKIEKIENDDTERYQKWMDHKRGMEDQTRRKDILNILQHNKQQIESMYMKNNQDK